MARIAVAGFQHETNTFSNSPALLEHFIDGGGWPSLQIGNDMLDTLHGMNLPAAGAIEAIRQSGNEPVPLIWTAATPSGRVEQNAFEHLQKLLLDSLKLCGPLDGVYLDLHGAMASDLHDDAEGILLKNIRHQIGNIPLAVSLDLHANVSREMFDASDIMVGYRTYPHVDMADSGKRTAKALIRRLEEGSSLAKEMVQLNVLLSLTAECTLAEPTASLYRFLEHLEHKHDVLLSMTLGFPLADIYDCGPAIFGYGSDIEKVQRAVSELHTAFEEAVPRFDARFYDADDAVRQAIEQAARGNYPVILADTQDNPGGGGKMDTTGLLQALIAANAKNAVVAMLYDPEVAALAHEAGIGATLSVALGGKLNGPGSEPIRGNYLVERLSDGQFTGTGPMWGGMEIRLGNMALLRINGVRIIVASSKMQAADQSILTHFGIEPTECHVIALKSSVHFRADFDRIAASTLIVASPGAVNARLSELTYRALRPGMHLLS
ncbi:M81 family metallopeptidase [Herbaspirillum sp. alder98]|uniref:M81 family metallopeptidase n=1 Tax=Herbaspirillum sp. alder98 TaxID=2913096 RepID=UPI001CD87BEE|nr:M81 family metallopeptidase [Herbaspirillum sp. alder98]MCA1326402.1 M81 family metallopeptidase [Herbaspirillum sp. alder98]